MHPCIITSPSDLGNGRCIATEAEARFGEVYTGRSKTFWGYFVLVIEPFSGARWLGEDRGSLRKALAQAAAAARADGWSIEGLGLNPEFKETGLSANSGYGIHPAYPGRHVHMLEPPPRERA